VLESLVKAGALDSLAAEIEPIALRRARLFSAVDKAIEHGGRHQRNREEGKVSFFDLAMDDEANTAIPLPDAPAWTDTQQLAGEKEALGFYMSGHPLERFGKELAIFGARRIGELTGPEGDVWIAGIVSGIRALKTRKGDRMAVFMLDDVDGSVEVVVFPEAFAKHASLVEADAMLLVRGKLEKDDETARLVASELLPIAALVERTTREVEIHVKAALNSRSTFEALAELLSRHRGDRRVSIEMDVNSSERPMRVRADVNQRVKPTETLVAAIEQLCGAGSVVLK
jgi:DNA polymerase III subunit alpha